MANQTVEVAQKNIYIKGCYDALMDDIRVLVIDLGVVVFILAAFQVSKKKMGCCIYNNFLLHFRVY